MPPIGDLQQKSLCTINDIIDEVGDPSLVRTDPGDMQESMGCRVMARQDGKKHQGGGQKPES